MALSCLFTLRIPIAAFLKKDVKVQIFQCYKAHFHKCAVLKQYEATQEKIDPQDQKENDHEDLKIKILSAALTYVPEFGWSEKSLAYGAKSQGISLAAHTLIEGGGAELVHFFNHTSNLKLEDYLKNVTSSNNKIHLQEFMTDALENRLRMIIPYLSKWPEALALMAIPTQLPVHTKNILDLVDIVWHYYGDKSLNTSWYTKRILLAVAYKTSELSLIQDKSEDYTDTFQFLERRVENVIEANNFVHSVSESNKHLKEFGDGAFITARNLLGLNRWFR